MADGKPGRPPLPEDVRLSEPIKASFRLTAAEMNELCKRAIAQRVSLNLYVRDIVRRDLGIVVGKT